MPVSVVAVADADADVARDQRLRERVGAGPDLLDGAGLLDRAQGDDLAVAHADQRRALACRAGGGGRRRRCGAARRAPRAPGRPAPRRAPPARAARSPRSAAASATLQRAREPADALGVALARHEAVEQVAAHDLAVAPHALQLVEEGVGHVARHLVDVAHDAPGDHERRLALGRVAASVSSSTASQRTWPHSRAARWKDSSEMPWCTRRAPPARSAGELPVVRVAADLEQRRAGSQLLVR